MRRFILAQEVFLFGTVGTPRSRPKKPGGTIGTIQYLSSIDLRTFEIGWVRSVRVSEATCKKINAAGQEAGVQLSVHAPYYINLNADAEEWPKSRKRLMDAARAGFLSGATDIVFHPGSYFERPAKQVLEVAIPRLRGCAQELQGEGNTVTLRPETMGKGAMLGSLEDTLTMSVEIDGVEPCLDFAHLHARPGDGSVNSYEEWIEVFESYQKALGKSALERLHCHLSGIEYTEAGEQNHLMLADSDFDLDGLLRALIDMDCAGRILCESPQDMDKDALIIKERLAELREAD
jgi:deoxyribonuclease-4